ncbi:MAG: hypothetical protein JWM68_303 [Verrucomicrobiales bacterium]|nr:hypothetical protein [Verrucomicrobiales bacterium]
MINWTEFEKLSGSVQHNFEFLCRALIRLLYERYGQFAALANQPGVEFHLRLQSDCKLGSVGRWYGWQCRWYDLASGKALGFTRRKKIEEALKKTTKVLPELTDWVLWTRHPLTKDDQKWFYALKTKMRLALWTSAEAEALLAGEAEILRQTYFGELLLTPNSLSALHDVSVAPIRKRWLPEVHQTVDAERTLRRMLGEAESWEELTAIAGRLLAAVSSVTDEPSALKGVLASLTPEFTATARQFAQVLRTVHQLLKLGDLETLRVTLDTRPRNISTEAIAAPRRMRGIRLPCGLVATNALADLKLALKLLDTVDGFLGVRLIAVIADAGGGKTQLAAGLTAPLQDRPAGVFLRGSELHSGRTIDNLAGNIKIKGIPVPSMEALLAALDAAGQRARRRLPLVIDGLNEAEDPRQWKPALASLNILLKRFANVLVVCTVRPGIRPVAEPEWQPEFVHEPPTRLSFAHQALPDDVEHVEIPSFQGDTGAAIEKYFKHFRINREDAELPYELLSNPLTLRIYCEVTNPERKVEVGVEAMPSSLTGLFGKYLERAIERIGELAPRNQRYYEHDIRRVIDIIGTALWEDSHRELSEQKLRKAISDDVRPWNESIIHLLEQEGVILLIPGESPGARNIVAAYDALGGYLIANAILAKHGHSSFESWLREPATLQALNSDNPDCHPLALDIFRSLVGLVPRRGHRQLWQMLDEPLRSRALRMASALEGSFLDAATVTALSDHVRKAEAGAQRMFLRLFHTRASVSHPLNADFLDTLLRSMSVGDRDLHWTEWLRRNSSSSHRYGSEPWLDIYGDIYGLEQRWKNLAFRTASDRLRAKWLMWLLPTTTRNLRDRITRALFWFGRGDPAALFEITERAADINDPYVFERMLAASYGVAMACHSDPKMPAFSKTVLKDFARKIFDLMFKVAAASRTTHVITREYGSRLIELTAFHNRKFFSVAEIARSRPPFADGGRIAWQDIELPKEKEKCHGAESPFRMDFENYTLGRLARGRRNYDFNDDKYRMVHAQVLWRVKQLGWTAEKFQNVDRVIESDRRYSRSDNDFYKVDRYGKKYSWIAFFELRGWLQDQGLLDRREVDERTSDVDIDPSFPNPTAEHCLVTTDFLGHPKLSLENWIKKGPTPDVAPFIRQAIVRDEPGPWIMLDGIFTQEDETRGRRIFTFIRSFVISKKEEKAVVEALTKQPLGARWLPEKPESIYTFAGEMPWCTTLLRNEPEELRFVVNEKKVKVKRKRPAFFLDGKPINITGIDLLRLKGFGVPISNKDTGVPLADSDLKRLVRQDVLHEVEEIQQEFRTFRTIIPVRDLGFEGRGVDDKPIHGITLAKQFAQACGLVHLPQTHDLQSKDGKRATYGIAFRESSSKNSERFFFIREEVLWTYLKKQNLSLVWAIWGERELSYEQLERARPGGDLDGSSHGNFQTIIPFK